VSGPTILLGESRFADRARVILEEVGEVVDFENPQTFAANLPKADAVVVGFEVHLRGDVIDRAEQLRVIASRTTATGHIDLEGARRRGIALLSLDPKAPALRETTSTAELTMALLLSLIRNVPWAFASLKDGRWERSPYGGRELHGKTLGIVGFGRLGRMVGGYGRGFGMRVLVHDVNVKPEEGSALAAEQVPLEQLLRESDVVSIHCTWSEETQGLIGAAQLELMRPGSLLVNTARGEIVDESALLGALESGRIAGAAVDTLAGEQPDGSHLTGNPLVEYARTHENLIVLPHLGGSTLEATERTQVHISELLADWLAQNF
jgi:D-3-phosphoglycerate dehydrogenase